MSSILARSLIRIVKNFSRDFQTTCIIRSCILDHSPNAKLNKHIADKYLCLPIPECTMIAEYIWIDGTGENLRSKLRTMNFIPSCVEEYPKWSYDGNATYQKGSANADMILVPAAVYNDPFRRGNNKLVLCEVYSSDRKPCRTNNRAGCATALKATCHEEPMFSAEQEFAFLDFDDRPFGWPIMNGHPAPAGPSGPHFCGIGAKNVYARDIIECMYRAALYAGITLYGAHAEIWPAQWEYQTGPTIGIKAADDVWMSRFILQRIAEEYGVSVSFEPKLFPNWHGCGCHMNFSTKTMRADGGKKKIDDAICRLSKRHMEHLIKYSPRGALDNLKRLTGKQETSEIHDFTYGVGVRNVSIRMPTEVVEKDKGYLEDRRPGANCDPYAVIEALVRTCLIDEM